MTAVVILQKFVQNNKFETFIKTIASEKEKATTRLFVLAENKKSILIKVRVKSLSFFVYSKFQILNSLSNHLFKNLQIHRRAPELGLAIGRNLLFRRAFFAVMPGNSIIKNFVGAGFHNSVYI